MSNDLASDLAEEAWRRTIPLRLALDGRDDATPLYLLHPRIAPLAAVAAAMA